MATKTKNQTRSSRNLSIPLAVLLGFLAVFFSSELVHSKELVFSRADEAPSVGVSARIQGLVLSGTELRAKPLTDYKTPVVLRMENRFVHADSFRYDLIYYGLDPGTFNLKDYLERMDGSTMDDLPDIPVEIRSVLPPGQVKPNTLRSESPSSIGGYRLMMWMAGGLWFIGLLVICFWGRKKRGMTEFASARPKTLAEQLRPLVEAARAGTLPARDLAELEHLLLAYWHKKLNLESLPPALAIRKLKEDSIAGNLFRSMDEWLHNPDESESVNVAELLAPYENAHAVQLDA